jgi:hypothetical protein
MSWLRHRYLLGDVILRKTYNGFDVGDVAETTLRDNIGRYCRMFKGYLNFYSVPTYELLKRLPWILSGRLARWCRRQVDHVGTSANRACAQFARTVAFDIPASRPSQQPRSVLRFLPYPTAQSEAANPRCSAPPLLLPTVPGARGRLAPRHPPKPGPAPGTLFRRRGRTHLCVPVLCRPVVKTCAQSSEEIATMSPRRGVEAP